MTQERTALRTLLTLAKSESENGALYGRVVPYNVTDNRPGELNGKKYLYSIYEPGCFAEWIGSYGTSRTKFLFEHGDAGVPLNRGVESGVNALPIGAVRDFVDDSDGLYFNADFSGSELAQNVRELAEMGGLTDISFACVVTGARVEGDVRHVYNAQLWDVSVVVWGQFLEGSPILEVYRKERNEMKTPKGSKELNEMVPSTIGGCAEAVVYEALTDYFTTLRSAGAIDSPTFIALAGAATNLLSSVSAALGDAADIEVSSYYIYYARTTTPAPEAAIEPVTPITDPAPVGVAEPDPDADKGADLSQRTRLAEYDRLLSE